MNIEMIIEVTDLDEKLTKDFVTFCCKELDISPSQIDVEGWPEPLKNNALGLCYNVTEDEYLIMVSTRGRTLTEIYNTIAHELIHVKQYEKDDLDVSMAAHKPAYEDRWWEIEAREKSLDLVKKYVDILTELV